MPTKFKLLKSSQEKNPIKPKIKVNPIDKEDIAKHKPTLFINRPGEFAVYDNFLDEKDFNAAWIFAQKQQYTHSPYWIKVWRINDGNPLGGHLYDSEKHPFGDFMDVIYRKIISQLKHHPDLIKNWEKTTLRSYIYKSGERLSWHDDGIYLGACILYLHPKWSAYWGGELQIASIPKDKKNTVVGFGIKGEEADELMNLHGFGNYITPLPNRLVFTNGGMWHATNRVDSSAGDNFRCSITAFFE